CALPICRGQSHLPVLLGGAALTRTYVESDLRQRYPGPLFYCRDAFAGLQVMDQVAARKRGEDVGPDWGRTVATRRVAATGPVDEGDTTAVARSDVARDVDVPTPPFWGTRVVRGIPLDDVAAFLNRTALFRTQWGFDRDQAEQGEAALRRMLAEARADNLLVPQVVYGYFACASEGNDLLVYAAPDGDEVVARFTFPRQTRGRRLCIADFFRDVDAGERDVIAFQAVTVGPRVTERAAELFAADRYTEYLYLHGL